MYGWVAVGAVVALNNGYARFCGRHDLMMSYGARAHPALGCAAIAWLAYHWWRPSKMRSAREERI